MNNLKSRRNFLIKGITLGIGLPIVGSNLISCLPNDKKKNTSEKKLNAALKILILGGTSFLGPHQIAYARSRGHTITTFTRGKTKPTIYKELFDDVEQLIGDRENDLLSLEKGVWDVVIDNSGHRAEWTKKTAELLKERVSIYLYTSSTGVFYPYLDDDIKEEHKVLLEEPEEIENEETKLEYWYGVMKANSERETIKAFGKERSIIVRPTYMVGPADRHDRFIHWPLRLSKGGEIMIPGKLDDRVQYIDVRDVAEWMIRLAEEKATGIYNAVGPKEVHTMTDFIMEAKEAFDVESSFVHIDDYEFLKEYKIPYAIPWIMPEGNNYGSARINNQKALMSGLTFRTVDLTVKDIYNWWYSDALTTARRNEFESNPETLFSREKQILEDWKKRQKDLK